jgi:hypothetical protein
MLGYPGENVVKMDLREIRFEYIKLTKLASDMFE